MKTKLNLTIDINLIPISKNYAQIQGISLSQLVENLLREKTSEIKPTFSEKWRGQFNVSEKNDARYNKLKKRYLV